MLKEALEYLKHGYNVIPSDYHKKPLVPWVAYQNERVTEENVYEWWKKWPSANISIITGKISNLFVIDTDTKEATEKIQNLIPENYLVPCQETPRGGMHFFFSHFEGIPNKAKVEEGIDVRTQGGVIMVAPSINGHKKAWKWLEGLSILEVEPPPMPWSLVDFLKQVVFLSNNYILDNNIYNNLVYNKESTKNKKQLSTTVYNAFSEGSRDDTLFHIANAMVKAGSKEEVIRQTLEILGKNCNPPFPEKELYAKIESAFRRAERRDRKLSEEIREWVCLQEGTFCLQNVYNDLQLSTRDDKKNTSIILKRLCEQGLIEKYGNKSGHYRRIENDCKKIDWYDAEEKPFDVKWPFGIETMVEIMPKNVIVIAGEKNAGKTSFLLNFCQMNLGKEIHYFSSEMADSELKKRLKKFSDVPLKRWQEIDFRDRMSDFHDVIYPDAINIIDFLEIYEEFYKIGLFIRQIYDKLNRGICIIAIQKNPGVDWGLGGARSLEKARLYLSIAGGKLKIVSGKNWASELNPNGLVIDFKLVNGAKFIQKSDGWYRD